VERLNEDGNHVNGVQIQFYIDTGTEVNIINKKNLTPLVLLIFGNVTEVARISYNGQTVTYLGKGRAVFKHRDRRRVLHYATRIS